GFPHFRRLRGVGVVNGIPDLEGPGRLRVHHERQGGQQQGKEKLEGLATSHWQSPCRKDEKSVTPLVRECDFSRVSISSTPACAPSTSYMGLRIKHGRSLTAPGTRGRGEGRGGRRRLGSESRARGGRGGCRRRRR